MHVIRFYPDFATASNLVDDRITTNRLAIKHRYVVGLTIVGPDLLERTVVDQKDPHYIPGQWFTWVFLNPLMTVRLVYDEGRPISLEELKRRVIARMSDGSLWEASGNPAEYRERVSRAGSFDEIWHVMGGSQSRRA